MNNKWIWYKLQEHLANRNYFVQTNCVVSYRTSRYTFNTEHINFSTIRDYLKLSGKSEGSKSIILYKFIDIFICSIWDSKYKWLIIKLSGKLGGSDTALVQLFIDLWFGIKLIWCWWFYRFRSRSYTGLLRVVGKCLDVTRNGPLS